MIDCLFYASLGTVKKVKGVHLMKYKRLIIIMVLMLANVFLIRSQPHIPVNNNLVLGTIQFCSQTSLANLHTYALDALGNAHHWKKKATFYVGPVELKKFLSRSHQITCYSKTVYYLARATLISCYVAAYLAEDPVLHDPLMQTHETYLKIAQHAQNQLQKLVDTIPVLAGYQWLCTDIKDRMALLTTEQFEDAQLERD